MKTMSSVSSFALIAALGLGLVGCSVPNQVEAPPAETTTAPPATNTPVPRPQPNQDAQRAALDKYVAAESAQIPQIYTMYPGVYSDVRVEAELPATITYSYVYLDAQDGPAVAAQLDTMIEAFQQSFDTVVFPSMKQFGIEGQITGRYVYYNPNGDIIWQQDFTS